MCSPPLTAPSIHSGIAASAGRTRGKRRRGGEEHREEREGRGAEKRGRGEDGVQEEEGKGEADGDEKMEQKREEG